MMDTGARRRRNAVLFLTLAILGGLGGLAGCALFNSPPVPDFTFRISWRFVPCVVRFDASSSHDPDGAIAEYEWDFGDGSRGAGVSISHTYETAGTFTVALTVTDDGGKTATTTATLTSQPVYFGSPVASFVMSTGSGAAPLIVNLDASSSSDMNGRIVDYSWDFGDGDTETGVSVSHLFRQVGAYAVALTVTDNDGLVGRTSQTLQVVDEADAPLLLTGEGSPRDFVPFVGTNDMTFFVEGAHTVILRDAQRRYVALLQKDGQTAQRNVSGFGDGYYYLDIAADDRWAVTVFRTCTVPEPPCTFRGHGQPLPQYTARFNLGSRETRFYWHGVGDAVLLSLNGSWIWPLVDQDSDDRVLVEAASGLCVVRFIASGDWEISIEQERSP